MREVSVHTNRAAEELRTIQRHDGDTISGGALTFLTWHVANLVRQATDGRYAVAVLRDGVEVEPIAMKDDSTIEPLKIIDQKIDMTTAKIQPLGFAIGRSLYAPNPTVIGAVEKTPNGNTAVRIGTVLEVGTVVQTEPPTVVGEDNGSFTQTGYVVLTPAERLELVSRLAAHASREELAEMAERITEAERVA